MLKKIYSNCEIKLKLKCLGPILVKSGYESEAGTKMAFITTMRGGKSEVFLPGSSLKGLLRSHFEKICRTLKEDTPVVCLPYQSSNDGGNEVFCGEYFKNKYNRIGQRLDNADVYKNSCPACRLFGSTYFIGRIHINDAYLPETGTKIPEVRPGVAIERSTGSAKKGGLYNYEAINDATFTTTILLRNFELWMLGALCYILLDFEDELLQVGAHKSRGMGKVKGIIEEISVQYYQDTQQELRGMYGLTTEKEQEQYGFISEIPAKIQQVVEKRGVRYKYDITSEVMSGERINLEGIFKDIAPNFNQYIQNVNWLQEIQNYSQS